VTKVDGYAMKGDATLSHNWHALK